MTSPQILIVLFSAAPVSLFTDATDALAYTTGRQARILWMDDDRTIPMCYHFSEKTSYNKLKSYNLVERINHTPRSFTGNISLYRET